MLEDRHGPAEQCPLRPLILRFPQDSGHAGRAASEINNPTPGTNTFLDFHQLAHLIDSSKPCVCDTHTRR